MPCSWAELLPLLLGFRPIRPPLIFRQLAHGAPGFRLDVRFPLLVPRALCGVHRMYRGFVRLTLRHASSSLLLYPPLFEGPLLSRHLPSFRG